MSRAPWVLLKPERGIPRGHEELHSTTLGWRMVNPRMPERWTISLGESAEHLAELHSISRSAQDEFALRSHRLAAAAWEQGRYDDQIVGVPGVELERDESIRPETTIEALSKLRPVFREDGTVTAGNASPLNDGAAAALVGDEAAAARGSAGSRSRGSPPGLPPASTPTSSGSVRCRRRTTPSSAPGSAGTTWSRWS